MSRQISSQDILYNRIDTINANALSEFFSGYIMKKVTKSKNKQNGRFIPMDILNFNTNKNQKYKKNWKTEKLTLFITFCLNLFSTFLLT